MSQYPPSTYQPATSNPYPSNPPPGSVVYNTQPGAVVFNASNQSGGYVPTSSWIPVPAPIEGVTPGLEYLTLVDTIVVKQIYEMLELISTWESNNRYSLRNANGEQVYFAAEETGCCERQCCGPQRGFTIHIVDNFKREVMTIRRPFKCCAFSTVSCLAGFSCCAQECTIESPPGNVIGSVWQRPTCCSIGLDVKDSSGNNIFTIQGPCECMLIRCSDHEFPIVSMNGNEIGTITKKWGGFCREAFSDADVFRVSFPMDLDVKMKAILLGATFLLDFMAFEMSKNSDTSSS